MGWCAVYGCNNDKNLHRFPLKNAELCRMWIHRCSRKDKFNVATARICAAHFEKSCFERDLRNELLNLPQRRILKADAAPTLNLPRSSSAIFCVNTPRTARQSRRDHQHELDSTESVESRLREASPNSLISKLKQRIKIQSRKITFLQNRVKSFRKKYLALLNKQRKYLNQKLSGYFTQGQVKCILNDTKSTRWTTTDLQMAVRLRTLSKRAYTFLRDVQNFPLPGLSTLSEWIKKTVCEPGIQFNILSFLHQKLESMSLKDKATAICIDEMSIRKDLVYSRLHDRVYGPHKKLVVVMARGLFSNWKQPVYFDFDTLITPDLLHKILNMLFSSGLRVHACISDMGAENRKMWKDLGVSEEISFIKHPSDANINVFFFADIPHMLKLTRNHILDHGLKTPTTILDKSLFEKLLASDSGELKLCPKLSRSHIDLQKMSQTRQRVRPAAELLSTRVSKAIEFLYPEETAKASAIRVVDNFFDVFNSRIPYADKPMRCGYGVNLDEQSNAVTEMEHLVKYSRVGHNKHLLPFQKGILMSIKSLRMLLPELTDHYSVAYLLTHRVNQDCLESFFSQIRGASGFLRHPSPLDVIHNIRKLVASGTCGEIRTGNTCVDDSDILTAEVLSEVSDSASAIDVSSTQAENDDCVSGYLEIHNISEKGGLEYVAGFVAHRLRLEYPELGVDQGASGWISYVDRGGLTTPSESWLEYCHYLEHHFVTHNGDGLKRTYSLNSLINSFKSPNPGKFPQEAVILYLKTRFFIRLKSLNESVKAESQSRRAKRKLKDHKE